MRISDWSSDVCSSDLCLSGEDATAFYHDFALIDEIRSTSLQDVKERVKFLSAAPPTTSIALPSHMPSGIAAALREATFIVHRRAEERRVGKARVSTCRSRWSP